jgi:hypothetical protein
MIILEEKPNAFMNVDFGKPIEGIVNEYHEPWRHINMLIVLILQC